MATSIQLSPEISEQFAFAEACKIAVRFAFQAKAPSLLSSWPGISAMLKPGRGDRNWQIEKAADQTGCKVLKLR